MSVYSCMEVQISDMHWSQLLCTHHNDVGVSCTNLLDAATIVGNVLAIVLFFTLIFATIALCLCYCWPSHHHHSSSSKALQDTDFLHYRLSAATTTTSTTAPPPPYSPDDTTYTPLQSKGYRPSAPRYISRRKTKLTVVSVLCNESRDSISTKRSWSMLSLLLLISLFMVFRSDAGEGDLRLVNKWHHGQCGRLEYQLHNGTWGTICDNGFGDNAADVACRQLGYRRAKAPLYQSFVNQPINNPIVIDLVICVGNEQCLLDCFLSKYDGTSPHCNHDNDIGIHCTDQLATSTITLITVLSLMTLLCSLCICCTCRKMCDRCDHYTRCRPYTPISYYASNGWTSAPPPYKDACEESSTEVNSTYQTMPSPTLAPPSDLNTMPPSYTQSQSTVQPKHPPPYQ